MKLFMSFFLPFQKFGLNQFTSSTGKTFGKFRHVFLRFSYMSLSEYKNKRSFSKTPEPSGTKPRRGKSQKNELLFVVQKHHASHLHYDFRLELKGALKSWAVPKGPSMNPDDKRLAMLVEDHPFDYKDFEGVIPKGNYGAGTVIIWDQGTYEPVEEAATKSDKEKLLLKGFYSGTLKIRLKGKKLKGEFVLVRSENRGDNSWLLIKKKDEQAGNIDITKKDRSVVSGKTLQQVSGDKKSQQWISNRTSSGKLKKPEEEKKEEPKEEKRYPPPDNNKDYDELVAEILSRFKKTKRTPMPENIQPMLATPVNEPFDKPEWIYEVKWDGHRALAYLNKGKVELRSRDNASFNKQFYPVHAALKEWPIKAVVDGEIVVVDEKGISAFRKLEEWKTVEDGQLEFYLFDILWLNGISLMDLPLIERRQILEQLVPENEIIRFSESFAANGKEFFKSAEKLGIGGILAKRADSIYQPNVRTKNWLKIKTSQKPKPAKKAAAKPKAETQNLAEELSTSIKAVKKTPNKKTASKNNKGLFLNAEQDTQEKTINGQKLIFTNLNKIYWPAEKLTKRDMLNYYHAVAPYMLPYMKDRPQSLNRHPNGINGKNFFQKDVAGKVEDWLTTHYYENTTREGIKTFLVCTDEASLMYMANMGCIEMNPWHSRTSSPDNPDWCVIDLDPDNNPYNQVIEVANVIRKILDSIKVPSFPKTSGSTGMHIYIPLGAKYSYDQSKTLAELIVHLAHKQVPDFTSLERNPDKRKGKIYLDFLQNRATQTLAAPYSVRPKPGATVSTPLHWDEVKKGLEVKDFTILNMPARIKAEGDLFKGLLGRGIDLEKVLKKISSVFG
jgi:bifunctional non-homologous end joining protein LigD